MSLQVQLDLLQVQIKKLEKKAAIYPGDPDINRTLNDALRDELALKSILYPESVVEVPVVDEIANTVDETVETVIETAKTVDEIKGTFGSTSPDGSEGMPPKPMKRSIKKS